MGPYAKIEYGDSATTMTVSVPKVATSSSDPFRRGASRQLTSRLANAAIPAKRATVPTR